MWDNVIIMCIHIAIANYFTFKYSDAGTIF